MTWFNLILSLKSLFCFHSSLRVFKRWTLSLFIFVLVSWCPHLHFFTFFRCIIVVYPEQLSIPSEAFVSLITTGKLIKNMFIDRSLSRCTSNWFDILLIGKNFSLRILGRYPVIIWTNLRSLLWLIISFYSLSLCFNIFLYL